MVSSDDVSPLWCANDEPHSAHSRWNEFNGTDYCTGRPSVSSSEVKITDVEGSLWVDTPYSGLAILPPRAVAALRAHFAAESHSGLVEMLRRERDELAALVAQYEERMPEDVQALVEEARTNILDGFSLDPYGKARRAREARGDLIRRLAAALEAAYSKGDGDDSR